MIAIPDQRQRRRFRTPEESLAARTVRDGDCLRWTGYRKPQGYGMISAGPGSPVYVHRYAYALHKGPIPDGMQIDHLCGIRDCVNPDHLEAVSQAVNLSRARRHTEQQPRTHCRSGHAFTPENTYRWRDQRRCRTCMREQRQRQWTPPQPRH